MSCAAPNFKSPYTIKNGHVKFSTYLKMLLVPYIFDEGVNGDSIMMKASGRITCNDLVSAMINAGFFLSKKVGNGKYYKLSPWIESKVESILKEAKEKDPDLDISKEGLMKNHLYGKDCFPKTKKRSEPCIGNHPVVPMENWECICKLDRNVRELKEKM